MHKLTSRNLKRYIIPAIITAFENYILQDGITLNEQLQRIHVVMLAFFSKNVSKQPEYKRIGIADFQKSISEHLNSTELFDKPLKETPDKYPPMLLYIIKHTLFNCFELAVNHSNKYAPVISEQWFKQEFENLDQQYDKIRNNQRIHLLALFGSLAMTIHCGATIIGSVSAHLIENYPCLNLKEYTAATGVGLLLTRIFWLEFIPVILPLPERVTQREEKASLAQSATAIAKSMQSNGLLSVPAGESTPKVGRLKDKVAAVISAVATAGSAVTTLTTGVSSIPRDFSAFPTFSFDTKLNFFSTLAGAAFVKYIWPKAFPKIPTQAAQTQTQKIEIQEPSPIIVRRLQKLPDGTLVENLETKKPTEKSVNTIPQAEKITPADEPSICLLM